MTSPFETREKREFRERLAAALDAAGFDVAEGVQPIAPPSELGVGGAIVGDVQASDADGIVHVFYGRIDELKAVPTWLANLARASHTLQNVRVILAVESAHDSLVASCEASGAGLIRLNQDNTLDLVVDATAYDPEAERVQITARIKLLRRRLKTKSDLNGGALQDDFSRVQELTAGMGADERAEWARQLEEEAAKWEAWSERLSEMLSQAANDNDDAVLDQAELLINQGP